MTFRQARWDEPSVWDLAPSGETEAPPPVPAVPETLRRKEAIRWPELSELEPLIADGLVRRTGARIDVTEAGRPLLRAAAAIFDAYLRQPSDQAARPRHSRAV